jgi:hypothetical protein
MSGREPPREAEPGEMHRTAGRTGAAHGEGMLAWGRLGRFELAPCVACRSTPSGPAIGPGSAGLGRARWRSWLARSLRRW